MPYQTSRLISISVVTAFFATSLFAKEVKDSPLLSRMPGATVEASSHETFGSIPILDLNEQDKNKYRLVPIEGQRDRFFYILKSETSSLAITRNIEDSTKNAGFVSRVALNGDTLFSYLNDIRNLKVDGYNTSLLYEPYYRYFTRKTSDGNQHIAVYVSRSDKNKFHLYYFIAQEKAQQMVALNVSKADIIGGLKETGKIALYGIYFDTGKADIKPESKATLSAIAEALRESPNLNIRVVGHTDNTGNFDANLSLSEKRARAVKAALTKEFGVAENRLSAHGVSSLAPVASNDSETGKAKNRRVELVHQ